jgi:hypothetical protein
MFAQEKEIDRRFAEQSPDLSKPRDGAETERVA